MNTIRIRLYERGDAPVLYEAARESVPEVYPWLSWCHPGYKIGEAEQWIAGQARKQKDGVEFEFVILDDAGAFLGGCGLNQIDWDKKVANLGYWVRSSAAGQGIAVQAVKLLSTWGFENTDLTRYEIKVALGNVRSQRVAEKAGAVREGIREYCLDVHGSKHDAIIFSIEKAKTLNKTDAEAGSLHR